VNDAEHKVSSKSKKFPKNEKSSERLLNNHIESIFTTTPVSPVVNKKQSSESIVVNKVTTSSTDTNIPSINRTPSTGVTSQIMSTTNSMTPMSIHSKEIFTPTGTKYQSTIKQVKNVTIGIFQIKSKFHI
jgi:hypothetical protein